MRQTLQQGGPPLFGAEAIEVLERMAEGFYAVDRDWRLLYVNRSAELFWGLKREAIVGESMLTLFPQFAGSPPHEAHLRAFDATGPVRLETVSTANGRAVELNLFPDRFGLAVYFHDIGRLVQLEHHLRARDELLTLAELHAGIGVWDIDIAAGTLVATPQFFRVHGLEPTADPISIEVTRKLRHPEDRDRVTNGYEEAIAAGRDSYESEYRIVRPTGETRWILGRGRVVRGTDGKPVRYGGVDIDITERKAQEERLTIVTRELRHRANNTLAVIQAMARQTLRASSDLEDFGRRFEQRIRALADANDLLVRGEWHGVELATLVAAQLRPFTEGDGERVRAEGPSVILPPKVVETMALALHELATNASKHGALSVPDGLVSVTWTLAEQPAVVTVTWSERGGPPVNAPSRTGFGRFVIERVVATALNATVSMEFAPEGVEWRAAVPLEEADQPEPAGSKKI